MTEYERRLERAERIARHLDMANGTVSQQAAKQLRTLIRNAKRHHALGKQQVALNVLEWAVV